MGNSLFAVLFFVLGLSACHRPAAEGATPDSPPASVRVALTRQPQSALVHVAIGKGYFREQGLDVQPMLREYGKVGLETVIAGEADFAVVTETAAMFSVLKGNPVAIVATVGTSDTNNAVIARKASGVAVGADLKGKRIAYTPGTTSEFFLDSLLMANGLSRKAVVGVAMRPPEVASALAAGEVDAASTWAFWLVGIQRQLGAGGVTFYDRELYTQSFNLAARDAFVRDNRRLTERFLRALLAAESFMRHERGAALAIVAEAMQVEASFAADMLDRFDYRVALDDALLITLADETRWAIRNGLAPRADLPNYAAHVHADALRAVRPEAVRIRR